MMKIWWKTNLIVVFHVVIMVLHVIVDEIEC